MQDEALQPESVAEPGAAATAAAAEPGAAAAAAAAEPDVAADAVRLGRLASEELPALIARFEQSGLGELEIHHQDWRIRLRRSSAQAPAAVERPARRGRGQAPKEQPPSQPAGGPVSRDPAAPGSAAALIDGAHPGVLAVGPGRGAESGGSGRRRLATSPAVGYFSPLDALTSGHQVRSGDLLGHVDVLGVRQEVVAPMDGIVVRVLAEPGQAVEYGEELVRVDAMRQSSDAAAGSASGESASGAPTPGANASGASASVAPTSGANASGASASGGID
ncbi:MAG TPA: biotin/lipoyl-containing protein [Candidatus Limnocylindrales bacterium]|nr:biotin/lipoyl-containing protein [Candidatus Limnocylindrales bacterium]